ncbi:hypothetical protein DSECCO2_412280 [anaerobic digester metagenome]
MKMAVHERRRDKIPLGVNDLRSLGLNTRLNHHNAPILAPDLGQRLLPRQGRVDDK